MDLGLGILATFVPREVDGEGDDEGTARPESYPKFTARASNVAPSGEVLYLKRLLPIFMCTYIVIERERDVKA